MASVNRVTILGNTGRDPEIRSLPSGERVANLALATTERWKDKNSGELKEATEWHRVNFFGRLAEIVEQYVKKGDPLYVEGSIHTRKWTDKDGIEKYSTEIKGTSLQLLGSKNSRQSDDQPRQGPTPAQRAAAPARPVPASVGSGFDDMDNDVPF